MSNCALASQVAIGLLLGSAIANAQDRAGVSSIVFMIGEREYGTERNLRRFFAEDLANRGFEATFVTAPDSGTAKHDFTGLSKALASADLLFLSVRRRAPSEDQLNAVRDHLAAGKPLVAIRTASHPFDTKGQAPAGHSEWIDFDVEVLGGKYSGHYGDEPFAVEIAPGAADAATLTGVEIGSSAKLYQAKVTSPKAMLLLIGRRKNGEIEPVAWTNVFGPKSAKVFYTSLGIGSDFEQTGFRQLLLNAVRDSLGQEIDANDTIVAEGPSEVQVLAR